MNDFARLDQSVTDAFSFNEIIGAIFVRSQVIEQFMRDMLVSKPEYSLPEDFERKTFGGLLNDFVKYFPDIKEPKHPDYPGLSLYVNLCDTRDIRNDAAHGYHLAGMSLADLLHDYGSRADTNRFIIRGIRKSLWAIDQCLFDFLDYRERIDWKPSATQKKEGLKF